MSTEFDFDELEGSGFDFYGVDGQCFKLDEVVYEVIDEGEVLHRVEICHDHHSFHDLPIARVVIERSEFAGTFYSLFDLHDSHCWLHFGTACDEYDPGFIFDYTPNSEVPLD